MAVTSVKRVTRVQIVDATVDDPIVERFGEEQFKNGSEAIGGPSPLRFKPKPLSEFASLSSLTEIAEGDLEA